MLDQPKRREQATRTLLAFAGRIKEGPTAMPQMLVGLEFARAKPAQIVIASQAEDEDTRAMLDLVRGHARPQQVVLLADAGPGQKFLGEHADFYRSVTAIDDKATAYVCEDFACQLPTNDLNKLKELLAADD